MLPQNISDDVDMLCQKLWDSGNHASDILTETEFKKRLQQILQDAYLNGVYDICFFLLNKFDYYTQIEVNGYLKELYKSLESYNINSTNALFAYIKKKEGKINSSISYAMHFKNINNIPDGNFSDDIKAIPDQYWEHIETIVIIDDCCGTGSTLEKNFFNEINRDFSNKTIFYLVIHQMAESDICINSLMKKFDNLKIQCISINKSPKAFDAQEIIYKLDQFKNFSRKRKIRPDDILGYQNSEGLFAFYNNTPNNTFGLFRQQTEKNLPIFIRETTYHKKPFYQKMAEEKETRAKIRSSNTYLKEN